MGHEHSSSIIVGFIVAQDDLLMPFKTRRPEEFHMEDRFNPKTGAKLASQVKVVDREECEVYLIEGNEYEEDSEAVEALESLLNCQISLHGDHVNNDDWTYGVESKEPYGEEACEGDGIPLTYVAKVESDLKRIRGAFKERYGIELGTPGIYSLESYG